MNKTKLLKEFQEKGYGLKLKSHFSKEAQEYLTDRHNKGIQELKDNGNFPTEIGQNGYTSLLGVWTFTKSRGISCAIGKKQIWTASVLNNDL